MPKAASRSRSGTARAGSRRKQESEEELREIVESVGLWFESSGVPRMAGRVVGWLLVCDPPEQTMQELATNLNASMGSISTMTRILTQWGLIVRTSRAGERRIRYRIHPDAFSWTIEDRLAHIRTFLSIAERALVLLQDQDAPRRERLETIHKAIRFYEEELSALVMKWKQDKGMSASAS